MTDFIKLAEQAAQQLQGTCKNLAELGEEFENAFTDSKIFTDRLDELVFECKRCNWWCEISEKSEKCADAVWYEDSGWYCDECATWTRWNNI